MTEKPSKSVINTIWGLTLRESLFATLFGTLMAMTKFITRTHLRIPGHTAVFWMSFLVICCLWIKKSKAGTLAGSVAGFLVVIVFPGGDGVLNFFKYFFPGFTLDILFNTFPVLRQKWFFVAMSASISLSTKVMVDVASGVILQIPFFILIWQLRFSFFTHLLFGLFSGLIGYYLYEKYLLKRFIRK